MKRDPRTPRIAPVALPDLDVGDLEALLRGRLDATRLTGAEARGADLRDLVLDECLLERCVLDDAVLDGARIIDTVLDAVAATSLRGARLTLRDVRLDGCRIGAAEWFEAELSRVELVGCRVDYLGLADARLEDVRFTGCTIGDLDLRGASATRVALDGCRVRELSAADARLTALDLRGVELERIDGARSLAGAIVSDAQLPRLAPLLAEALGITVG